MCKRETERARRRERGVHTEVRGQLLESGSSLTLWVTGSELVVRLHQACVASLYPLDTLPSCPSFILRPGLSLNLGLPSYSRLASQQAPGSSPNISNPELWDYRHGWLLCEVILCYIMVCYIMVCYIMLYGCWSVRN